MMSGRTVAVIGSVLLLIAVALGLIRDWGQPFQGSAPVWLLLMGFAILLFVRGSKRRCPECGKAFESSGV